MVKKGDKVKVETGRFIGTGKVLKVRTGLRGKTIPVIGESIPFQDEVTVKLGNIKRVALTRRKKGDVVKLLREEVSVIRPRGKLRKVS